MRQIIEPSLVLVFALLLTVAIMAVIFPRHVLGGLDRAVEPPTILPAVFIDGTHDRPGSGGVAADRRFAGQVGSGACPYLAALAAASKCTATPQRDAKFSCPYLEQVHRQLVEADQASDAPLGQNI